MLKAHIELKVEAHLKSISIQFHISYQKIETEANGLNIIKMKNKVDTNMKQKIEHSNDSLLVQRVKQIFIR